MADYYPLLARALDALPDRSPALRKAVYERARSALIGQLRSLEPPLSDADIGTESDALETAIRRLETDYGGEPAPVVAPVVPTAPPLPPVVTPAVPVIPPLPPVVAPAVPVSPPPPVVAVPVPKTAVDTPLAATPAPDPEARPEPVMPPAPPPDLGLPKTEVQVASTTIPERDPPGETAPAVVIQPRRAKPSVDAQETDKISPAAQAPATAGDGDPSLPVSETVNGRQRPRIDVVAPRGGRSRLLRNIFVGSVLAIVIGMIATAAFFLRDKPADLQPGTAETATSQPEAGDSKYNDRIGGDPAPVERVPSVGQRPSTPIPAQPDVTVAQRAILYEENTTGTNAPPVATQGRVVWRLEAVSGEQGQPLEAAVRGLIEFPDAGLTLAMTLRRNLDATLPASHTIELAFTNYGAAGEKHAVQDVGLLQIKDEENARGSPVSGLPVRVRENLFLIGLSSLSNDIDRNTDLLLNKNWFDLAIKFTAGPRAIVSFEKGSSGAQVMRGAFEQWRP